MEIVRQENKSFVTVQMDSVSKVVGKDNLFFNHGKIHKFVKQITLSFLGSDGLKRNLISDMDRVTQEHLKSKANQGSFDVKDAVVSVSKLLCGCTSKHSLLLLLTSTPCFFIKLIVSYLTPKMISNLKPETQRKLMGYAKAFNFDWIQPPLTLSIWRNLFKALRVRSCYLVSRNPVYISRIIRRDT